MFLDIHSHILPAVDDGAKDIEESLKLLEMSYEQGITAMIATPHFYAHEQNIEEFNEQIDKALALIHNSKGDREIPEVYIGSEVYYFKKIGKSSGIRELTLGKSRYILLELPYSTITNDVLRDVEDLSNIQGLTPIIAHIERYSERRGYKKLLKLVKAGVCVAQINAASLLQEGYKKTVCNLFDKGYISFIGSDTHSVEHRPPLIKQAMENIEKVFGKRAAEKLRANAEYLYSAVAEKGMDYAE